MKKLFLKFSKFSTFLNSAFTRHRASCVRKMRVSLVASFIYGLVMVRNQFKFQKCAESTQIHRMYLTSETNLRSEDHSIHPPPSLESSRSSSNHRSSCRGSHSGTRILPQKYQTNTEESRIGRERHTDR